MCKVDGCYCCQNRPRSIGLCEVKIGPTWVEADIIRIQNGLYTVWPSGYGGLITKDAKNTRNIRLKETE